MTPSDKAALRALAEAATPGPWALSADGPPPDIIAGMSVVACTLPSDRTRDEDTANAAYIAAANPQAVLALLDEVGGWQPIATAPDDGSYVLLWDRNVGLLQGWQERDGKWCHAWDGEYIPRPEGLTHWRPEPKGPRA